MSAAEVAEAPSVRRNGHDVAQVQRGTSEELSPAERQRAARAAYRRSVTKGRPLTGAELGRRYGMSARWGRAVVAAERQGGSGASARPGGNAQGGRAGSGSRPGSATGTQAAPVVASRPAVERQPTPAVPEPPAAADEPAGDGRNRWGWADTGVTLVVALVAAAASWGHMVHVASLAGEPIWLARAFPITVDGLALAALRRGEQGRPWLVLALVMSVAANVAAQFPGLAAQAGPVVAAVPPVALYGCHRLMHHPSRERNHST